MPSPRLLRRALNATKTLIPMAKGKIMTRIFGERNLLKICLQNRAISLQVVNTAKREPAGGHIFLHATTNEKLLKLTLPNTSNSSAARETAKLLASRAQEAGQTLFTYERGKQRYMGKVKVIIETLREHGIRFVSRVESRKAREYTAADAAAAAAPESAATSGGESETTQEMSGAAEELRPLGYFPKIRMPGDWVCRECKGLNAFNVYARAHSCFRCGAPMPLRYAVPPNAVTSQS